MKQDERRRRARTIERKPQRKRFMALHAFQAKDERFVDLVTGEVVKEVEADIDGWTRVKKKNGSKGLVPTNFLRGGHSTQMTENMI